MLSFRFGFRCYINTQLDQIFMFFTFNIMMMKIYLVLLCILIVVEYTCVCCYHIKCKFSKDSDIGVVLGIRDIQEFIDFLNRCNNKEKLVIRYSECYVGKVELPVDIIVKNYPSVRIIIWDCEGLCTYIPTGCSEGKQPTIRGCQRGKS